MTRDSSTPRTESVTFYVDPDEKRALAREADAAGKSISTYVHDLTRRARQVEHEEDVAEEFDVERRLTAVATEAIEDIEDAAEDVAKLSEQIEEQQRLSGKYSIALWELLKQDYPDATRRDALDTSHERLNKVIDMDMDADTSDGDETIAERIERRRENNANGRRGDRER